MLKNVLSFTKKYVFAMTLILSILLSGCAAVQITSYVPPDLVTGQVTPTQIQTALSGIMTAMTGLSQTARIYQDPTGTQLLFSWPMSGAGGQGWCFLGNSADALEKFVVDQAGGNLGNLKTWETVRNLVESNGWKVVTAEAVSPVVRVGAVVYLGILSMSSATMTDIFIVPLTPEQQDDILNSIKEFINPHIPA